MPVPLHADARLGYSRPPAAAAAAATGDGGTAGRRRWRRSLLLAEARLVHFDAVLRRVHEHRLRQATGNGRRAVRLRVDRFLSNKQHPQNVVSRMLFPALLDELLEHRRLFAVRVLT